MNKWILILALAALNVSCKKEHDLSVFHGKWESRSIEITVTPQDPVVAATAEEALLGKYSLSRFVFGPGNEFREYRYQGNTSQSVSMMSGTYFYNKGYKGRYLFSVMSVQVLELDLQGDRLIARYDLTEWFEDPENLRLQNPKDHPFNRIVALVEYERADFEVEF